jgi:hypothetical protein
MIVKIWFPVLLIQAWAVGAEIEFTADPLSIGAGEKTMVTWNVEKTKSAYLSVFGGVAPRGSRELSLIHSTNVNLVSTVEGIIQTKTIRIVVTGSKGSSDFPSDEKFRFPLSGLRENILMEDFLAEVHQILQDDMRFSVSETKVKEQPYAFVTNLSERNSLVQPEERGIRARRIAYMVRVRPDEDRSKRLWFEVATYIEYQRRVESIWRPDSDADRYQAQAAILKKMLASPR